MNGKKTGVWSGIVLASIAASLALAGCVDLPADSKPKDLPTDFRQTVIFELRGSPGVEETVDVMLSVDNSTLWIGPIPASNGTGKYLHFSLELGEGLHDARVRVAEWGGSWKTDFEVPNERPAVVVRVAARSVTFNAYASFADADAPST
ncbi:MAG: hypothetical protein HY556_02285 [Euryarchaeota archaeon]|nr:hypothetical protein [Euryarchaeota archaeon]